MVWSIKVKPQIASQLFAIIFSESSMASRDKKSSKPSSSRGIRTLSDLNRPTAPDSDSDSDGPQEYYTGGEKRFLFSPSFFPFSMWIFCFPVWWLRNWRKRKKLLIYLFIYCGLGFSWLPVWLSWDDVYLFWGYLFSQQPNGGAWRRKRPEFFDLGIEILEKKRFRLWF